MMKKPHPFQRASRQRGVVLLFCLIILVVLLAGGVAIIRSMNSSMATAGNLAFRRDLVNQGEQAISIAMQAFGTGGALNVADATSSSLPAANYSAIQLKSNARGIPELLLKTTSAPSGPDVAGNTFTPTGGDLRGNEGVKIRYVIDRLCNATGAFSTLGSGRCIASPIAMATGGTAGEDRPSVSSPALYRVTVRVDGPRDTQVFLQSSFSKPE
jgi:Tfp pilus assembly protein PilX